MKPVYIEAVGLVAPGLPTWNDGLTVLAGQTPYVPAELPACQTQLLPPNERRRLTASVRLAFRVAEDALRGTDLPAGELATVFATSDGDLEVLHRINQTLAQPARTVSPTDFHNSVHNAAAGYWSIAVSARQASASIAAYDFSFAAGLLEAAALVAGDELNTLLAVYETPAPAPLLAKRPIGAVCGSALVLTPQRSPRSLGALELGMANEAETVMADPALEALRRANPAARALPLLRLLARRQSGPVSLAAPGGALRVQLSVP
jgi:hypothetical protein